MKRFYLLFAIVGFLFLSVIITTTACQLNVRTLSLSEESYKKIREFNSKFQFQLKSRMLCVENDSSQEKIKEKIISTFKDINKKEANNRFNLDENINFHVFFNENKINIYKYKINMVRWPEYMLTFNYKNLEFFF